MKTTRSAQQLAPAFTLKPVAAACAVALFSATAVYAQQPAPATPPQTEAEKAAAAKKDAVAVEKVTVTGIRRGIEDAISVKKDSNSIVEAISAEDIGKLPDNSIAESIARLPGLAAQRVAGRAQTISIRGLSGDFANTLLNGREQVSTGDNRAVEFDQYPSELLSAVVVYKTPDSSLVGQGLSGTVDLQTVRPLNFAGRTMAANVRHERNNLGKLNADSKDDGYRFNFSYIDQFANRTLGIALGYARIDTPSQVKRFEAWGYPTANGVPGIPDGTFALGGSKQFADSSEGKRDGFMGVLEWRPSKNFTSLLDVYYSKFDQKTVLRGYEAGLAWGENTTLTNAALGGGRVGSGTWTGVKPVIRGDLNEREDDIHAFGWNNKLNLGNGWTAVGDLSFSKADRKESILETYAGTVRGAANSRDVVRFTTDGNGVPFFTYGLDYTNPSIIRLTDSGGWGQDGYIKFPKVTDELKSFRVSGRKNLEGIFSGVEFGFNYADREKSRKVDEFFLDLKTRPTAIPTNLLLRPTSLDFVGVPGIIAYDINGAYSSLYNLRSNVNNADIINKDWRVQEKVSTLYLKGDIDTEWAGIPVRGNAGVQYAHTDQASQATAVTNGGRTQVPFADGKKYGDWLPSMNLAFSLPADQTVRVGVARTLARARLDQMRASNNFNLGLTDRRWSGDGGNPRLEPFRANAYDLSWEKYFGVKAYVGLAVFYKDLKSYIYQDNVARDFSGYPNPTNGAVVPISNIGSFNQPINGSGGNIKGFEGTLSLPLNLLHPVLDGFGTVASFSDTKSGIRAFGRSSEQPLPGLSRRVSNITAYYEKSGFQARMSQRFRSDFVGEVTGFGADREFRYIKAERVLDAQVGYSFDKGYLKGLSLLFQVNNVNNTPYQTYDAIPLKPNQYTVYGRTYLMGLSYKLQ